MTVTPDNELTRRVIECATEVHRQIGPGLSKEIYGTCLGMELTAAGLEFERGRVLPFVYDGHLLDFTIETDFIINDFLVLQVEAVDEIELIHEQQIRTCVFMSGFPLGILLNFNVVEMLDGVMLMPARIKDDEPAERDVFDDPELGVTC